MYNLKNSRLLTMLSALLMYTNATFSQNSQTFSYRGNFQNYTVPVTGWYFIQAGGGQGGAASNGSHQGGKGALVQGYLKLQAGELLRIGVGGSGKIGTNANNNVSGGGGGGASSVVRVNGSVYTPLIFAGGGGGAAANYNGSFGKNNTCGDLSPVNGCNGNGANVGNDYYGGAAGAGYYTDGGTHYDGSNHLLSNGGQAYLSGNGGGCAYSRGGCGGWGGGGQGGPATSGFANNNDGGGGGGGGWGGAGGGRNQGDGGGGGGSYHTDSLRFYAFQYNNNSDGYVSIEYVTPSNSPSVEFSYQGTVFQRYVVPASGWYAFDVRGAQGGTASDNKKPGGLGARITGTAKLQEGDFLLILVAGTGGNGLATSTLKGTGGGGGGASSIVIMNDTGIVPLIFAAGGGGSGVASYGGAGNPGYGLEAPINTTATNGNGGGTASNCSQCSAGGGGYYTNGTGWVYSDGASSQGGRAYLNGAAGGNGGAGGGGGWGGGGQGAAIFQSSAGGGGGGWNGGNCVDFGSGGNGGMSYVAPNLRYIRSFVGTQYGSGYVSIKPFSYSTLSADTTFSFKGNNFQYYVTPAAGYYQITTRGAQGGSVNGKSGGKGALMQGYYLFNAGDSLQIVVGGMGVDGVSSVNNTNWTGAGGGGASAVVLQDSYNVDPIIFAGGGGGASKDSTGEDGLNKLEPYRHYLYGNEAGGFLNGNGTNGNGFGFYYGYYGGSGGLGGDGGFGGGAEGMQEGTNCTLIGQPWGCPGPGGGGGGYNGANTARTPNGGGTGGDSYKDANYDEYNKINSCDTLYIPGANTGNGSVRITGPHVVIDTVNTLAPTYTWPANGAAYQHSGTYFHVDLNNCVVRVLDLSIGSLSACLNYRRVDTTIVSCGSYTNPLNGRTYTINTTDSFRLGCNKYVVRIIVAPPAALPGNMITGSTESSGLLAACKNTVQTYSIRPVPYATSYQWTLPSGATGTSTTNSITVFFSNSFSGGSICVKPLNACGAGVVLCRSITVTNTPPTGQMQITGPAAPQISGYYSVTSIPGATTYTWSVANNQAVILSGQGTTKIQLSALPGFTRTNLSVRASNCKGNGASATKVLSTTSNCSNHKSSITQSNTASQPISDVAHSQNLFTVYPNPFNGQFIVNTPSLKTDATLEVITLDGKKVLAKKIKAYTTQTKVFMPQYASGLYEVRLVTGGEVKSLKVVKY